MHSENKIFPRLYNQSKSLNILIKGARLTTFLSQHLISKPKEERTYTLSSNYLRGLEPRSQMS